MCRSCGASAPQKYRDITREAAAAGKGGGKGAAKCGGGGGGGDGAFALANAGAPSKAAPKLPAWGGAGSTAPWRKGQPEVEREQTAVEHCLEAIKHAKAADWPQTVLDVLEEQLQRASEMRNREDRDRSRSRGRVDGEEEEEEEEYKDTDQGR